MSLPPFPAAYSEEWYAWAKAVHDTLVDLADATSPIAAAPVATFTGSPLTGAPRTVQFTDLSTGNPTSYSWDFGDGGRSILASPSHDYTAGGVYTVKLTVTSAGGSNTMIRAGYVSVTLVPTSAVTITPTVGDGFVKLDWTAYPNATSYKVGRNGVDTTGYSGPTTIGTGWEEVVTGLTWPAQKLVNGTAYTFHVIPIVNGADGPVSTIQATPVAGSVTTNPTPTGSLAGGTTARRSGLTWNSIVFRGGESETYPQFEAWRGRPVDGVMFFPSRDNWTNLATTTPRRSGDLMVTSLSPFPEGGGSNQRVANGEFDSQIRALATKFKNAGWDTNRTVIRLGWESNGTWYQWGWDRGGVEAFKNAFRRFVQQCRVAGLTNILWNWCLNKGPQSYNSGYSWTLGYPGDDVVDIVGIDSYDHWSASFNETQWASNVAAGKNPGLEGVLQFCKDHGKLMAIDEWGVSHRDSSGAIVGGQDNPWYVGRLHTWLKANAQWIAYEVTYDHPGGPPSLNHMLSDGSNPQAAARYKQAWPNGWGA